MKEHDIRPQAIFEEYLRLSEIDTRTFFADAPRITVVCPACGGEGKHAFEKSGFSYTECQHCSTLYVNPRPARRAFERYYHDSPSTRYWATTFYKETEVARREQIWKPKAELIKATVSAYSNVTEIVDIGGGYGTFAEEIKRITDWNVVIIEPSVHLADVCRKKGFMVIEKFLENTEAQDLTEQQRCFVSFELFEHLYDPAEFLENLQRLMKHDDLFIFTTLNGLGTDIQVLWEHSKAVSPPHHLIFFNPSSIRKILAKTGFDTMQVTTPGKLDINIIENNLHYVTDRFWKKIILYESENVKLQFQEFISNHGLSSHMMVVCRKAA